MTEYWYYDFCRTAPLYLTPSPSLPLYLTHIHHSPLSRTPSPSLTSIPHPISITHLYPLSHLHHLPISLIPSPSLTSIPSLSLNTVPYPISIHLNPNFTPLCTLTSPQNHPTLLPNLSLTSSPSHTYIQPDPHHHSGTP